MDTNSILNPVGSIELNLFRFNAPEIILPDLDMKYEEPNRVLHHSAPELKGLIERMMLKMKDYDDRKMVIDYKVRTLKKGSTGSALYGYHLDCTDDIHDTFEPETHLIYSTIIGTSFVMNPINAVGYDSVQHVIQNEVLTEMVAPTEMVHKYDSKVLHSSPIITHDCQRILIRVTAGFKDRILHNKRK